MRFFRKQLHTPQPARSLRRTLSLGLAAACATVLIGTGPTAQAAGSTHPVLLVFGDSLSAEYGLKRATGWVALVQDRLKREGFPHRIVNASISGETTAGGLVRLKALLDRHKPAAVVIQLGANDGLRGLPVAQTERNLKRMLEMARAIDSKPMLVGIRVPPNYGLDYARQFDAVFTKVGRDTQTPVVPFFFEGFAERSNFFQADGIHPNEQAQPSMANLVWPVLTTILTQEPRS